MSESAKTGGFVVAAIVAAAVGYWASQPALPVDQKENRRGQGLFDFHNPLDATSLEIVKYTKGDDRGEPGKLQRFQVIEKNNRWLIPSHSNYPTDAKEQLGDAAKELTDLKVLDAPPESDSPAEDHKLYGVVDPDKAAEEIEGKAAIYHVTMKDRNDKTLLDLIIGNEVPGGESPGKPPLHFVRKPGEDQVYEVRVATDKLSTEFGDWIEKGLLKGGSNDMAPWDIKDLQIRDYTVDVAKRAPLTFRDEMTLAYNDFKWKLAEDRQGRDLTDVKMAADEELNTEKVEGMKTAVENLDIVDVEAKPEGVSADLNVTGGLTDNEAVLALLQSYGFYVASVGGRLELYSNQGEVRCQLKDGVLYILRFGGLATESTAGKQKAGSRPGTNRYIMVTAQFNPDVLPKPVFEPLPEEKPAGKPADDKAAAGKKAEQKKPEPKKIDVKAERARIEKSNKRLQEESDARLESGKKKAAELNARFAKWFYIISDDVYHKIHLSRADIVKKKEKEKPAAHDEHDHDHEHGGNAAHDQDFGPAALDNLKKETPRAPGK